MLLLWPPVKLLLVFKASTPAFPISMLGFALHNPATVVLDCRTPRLVHPFGLIAPRLSMERSLPIRPSVLLASLVRSHFVSRLRIAQVRKVLQIFPFRQVMSILRTFYLRKFAISVDVRF